MSYYIHPQEKSWIESANGSYFPIQNLPYGVYSEKGERRICVRIGNFVIDIFDLFESGLLNSIPLKKEILINNYLNDLIALGKINTRKLRARLAELLSDKNTETRFKVENCLRPIENISLNLPLRIGDYTDFYSSREHATNVGIMFRDPANALLPNWLYLPVGYHGRASSIVVSGTNIKRPYGQTIIKEGDAPQYGPSRQLDFELEMAFIIGKENKLGEAIPIKQAREHIFGLSLFNDWSARDIQKWEYVPLGPFLGKNFASTISPWIVDLDALEDFRVEGPVQEPIPLDYLRAEQKRNYDIQLEVSINDTKICHSNTKYLYWSMSQQLAHHTVNGCNMQVADLCASGTISGADSVSFGSMLELAWKGTKPIKLKDGSSRSFIQDGDLVKMSAFAENEFYKIGFGECEGKIIT